MLFLAWRAHERKGDSRFDEIKGIFFSFLVAWMFQGVWVFTISLPVIFVNGSDNVGADDENNLSVLEYITIVGFGLGAIFGKYQQIDRISRFCYLAIRKKLLLF